MCIEEWTYLLELLQETHWLAVTEANTNIFSYPLELLCHLIL